MVCIDRWWFQSQWQRSKMRNLAVSNEKIAEPVTTHGLWLTDDNVYNFQGLEYIIKWRNVHFSHLHKVCGNSIWIESSKNLHMFSIQPIVGNFKQPGQDFKFQVSRHHYLNLAVVISVKNSELTKGREGLYHWRQYEQVPLTFTCEEATQESCRNVKCNMSTVSFHNMDASKIYLWAKYIYE